MVTDEILLAIENVIYNFAQNQFNANNISQIQARLIMHTIAGKFDTDCLNSVIVSRINILDEKTNTGTVEALKEIIDGNK